jgi:diguanylate cyclase (GGDEF)-like protein
MSTVTAPVDVQALRAQLEDRARRVATAGEAIRRRMQATIDEQARRIADVEQINAELRRLAYEDSRTGLLNALGLELLWERLQDEAVKVSALLLLDLNGFKQVNDTYGHGAGDEELARVGRILGDAQAYAARTGGDEFVIILVGDDNPRGRAVQLADAIHTDRITVAVGVVKNPPRAFRESFGRADLAMYHAKQHAPASTVRVWRPGLVMPARDGTDRRRCRS